MEQDGREKIEYSQDEIDAINKDITAARSSLVSEETKKEIERAKEEARREAEKEFLVNQKIKELEEQKQRLEAEKVAQQKEFDQKFSAMEGRINDMIGSKAPAADNNPFKEPNAQPTTAENMSDDMINDIERASGEAFLGDEYLKPI